MAEPRPKARLIAAPPTAAGRSRWSGDKIEFRDAASLRAWLSEHHANGTEVWVVFRRGGRLRYEHAVEEALCFGWIDGVKKSLDAERYTHRFTPRRAESRWSPLNIRRAKSLIAQGRMTSAGLAAFKGHAARRAPAPATALPAELARLFKADARAWTSFDAFSPGYKKTCVAWIASAKRDATREKRLAAVMKAARAGRKVDFMAAGAGG